MSIKFYYFFSKKNWFLNSNPTRRKKLKSENRFEPEKINGFQKSKNKIKLTNKIILNNTYIWGSVCLDLQNALNLLAIIDKNFLKIRTIALS